MRAAITAEGIAPLEPLRRRGPLSACPFKAGARQSRDDVASCLFSVATGRWLEARGMVSLFDRRAARAPRRVTCAFGAPRAAPPFVASIRQCCSHLATPERQLGRPKAEGRSGPAHAATNASGRRHRLRTGGLQGTSRDPSAMPTANSAVHHVAPRHRWTVPVIAMLRAHAKRGSRIAGAPPRPAPCLLAVPWASRRRRPACLCPRSPHRCLRALVAAVLHRSPPRGGAFSFPRLEKSGSVVKKGPRRFSSISELCEESGKVLGRSPTRTLGLFFRPSPCSRLRRDPHAPSSTIPCFAETTSGQVCEQTATAVQRSPKHDPRKGGEGGDEMDSTLPDTCSHERYWCEPNAPAKPEDKVATATLASDQLLSLSPFLLSFWLEGTAAGMLHVIFPEAQRHGCTAPRLPSGVQFVCKCFITHSFGQRLQI